MTFLHALRTAANTALSPLGLAVMRTERQPWLRPKTPTTRVGRFSIQMPGRNQLASVYAQNPHYTGHLGRLARLLKKKYSSLAAIDIGANVGDTACIIKSAADIPILCIEGDDLIFGFLEQNLRQFQNASAHKLFLGEKTETLAVNLDKGGWNATLIPDKSGSAPKVKIISLDDFLATQPSTTTIKLVKIDTEGFDCAIIRGARKFIEQVHPVLTFEYNRDTMAALGEKGLDTLSMLASLGYARVALHDCDGRFFSAASMADAEFIRDIHEYADGRSAAIYYFDLTVFHEDDLDVAQQFTIEERAWRAN